MDFLHIWYHNDDQVPWATDAYEIEFGYVPNLSNYGHFQNAAPKLWNKPQTVLENVILVLL